MKLRVRRIDFSTSHYKVAILNLEDVEKLDLHREDRIIIKYKNKEICAVVYTTKDKNFIPKGYIGLNYESYTSLNIKNNEFVKIEMLGKPFSIDLIRKKLDKHELDKKSIYMIIKDIVDEKIGDIELTYFVSGSYINGLSTRETVNLTKAIVETGKVIKWDKKYVVDKHCIGGVAGNRTTMIIVPIIASYGLTIPKTSSRSITSPAGTADTMEVLANVLLDVNEMKKVVLKTNGCIVWGGALSLAPADDKIIRAESPLGIDAPYQIVASVLAKKKSVSSKYVLIDIPYGKGSKIKDLRKARKLKELFEIIGKKLGMKIRCILTDGKQPIGNGIGPALEARDVLYVLMNHEKQPLDLKEKALRLSGKIIEMVHKNKNGYAIAKKILESGLAYKKMIEIIKYQGKKVIDPRKIEIGKYSKKVRAYQEGIIRHIDNHLISLMAKIAGAPKDKGAGIYLYHHAKDKVKKNEVLFEIFAESKYKLNLAVKFYEMNKRELIKIK